MKISSVLEKIEQIKNSKGITKPDKKRVIDLFEQFKNKQQNIVRFIDEVKKEEKGKRKDKKQVDKVVKELEKLLVKQEKDFLKIAGKLNLDLDDENLIKPTKENIKKVDKKISFGSGGIFIFNYNEPISDPNQFNSLNPLDAHPLTIYLNTFISTSGNKLMSGFNLHHISASYRKYFWNWILREYLIIKNNRRKLEIPATLYYILKDTPELRFALSGYRLYAVSQIKNMKRIPIKEYQNIFQPKYKARFKIWNGKKFIQRGR